MGQNSGESGGNPLVSKRKNTSRGGKCRAMKTDWDSVLAL